MATRDSTADLVTVDDFYALVGDGEKADLIDGVIYLASPDSLQNDQLAGFLRRCWRTRRRRGSSARRARSAVALDCSGDPHAA
jgi:hypothetical protein